MNFKLKLQKFGRYSYIFRVPPSLVDALDLKEGKQYTIDILEVKNDGQH